MSDPYKMPYAAWQIVSEDKTETLVSVVMQEVHGNKDIYYVKFKGLVPEAKYCDEKTREVYYGSTLMRVGIALPEMKATSMSYQLYLKVVSK